MSAPSSETPTSTTETATPAAGWRPQLPLRNRLRPRAYGTGRYGVDKYDSRDNTRYAWTRVGPAITALLFAFMGMAAPARATNAFCESADAATSVYAFCKPSVDVEGANPWGTKWNTNADMVESALQTLAASTGSLTSTASTLSASTVALANRTTTLESLTATLSLSTESLSSRLNSVAVSTTALSASTVALSVRLDSVAVATTTLNSVKASTGASGLITSLPGFSAGGLADGTVYGQDIALSTIPLASLNRSGCATSDFAQWNGSSWSCGTGSGLGDAIKAATQTFSGANTFTGTTTFSGLAQHLSTATFSMTSTFAGPIIISSSVISSNFEISQSTFVLLAAAGNVISATTLDGCVPGSTVTFKTDSLRWKVTYSGNCRGNSGHAAMGFLINGQFPTGQSSIRGTWNALQTGGGNPMNCNWGPFPYTHTSTGTFNVCMTAARDTAGFSVPDTDNATYSTDSRFLVEAVK